MEGDDEIRESSEGGEKQGANEQRVADSGAAKKKKKKKKNKKKRTPEEVVEEQEEEAEAEEMDDYIDISTISRYFNHSDALEINVKNFNYNKELDKYFKGEKLVEDADISSFV